MSTLLIAPLSHDVPMMVRAHVAEWSARLRRPDDWIMSQALTAWLAQQATRRRQTLAALAEAGPAASLPHQAVQAWVASLQAAAPAGDEPASDSTLRWTRRSTADLAEVHRLLKDTDAVAAVAVLRTLLQAVQRLVDDFDGPEALDEFLPDDVRQVSVGRFDIRVVLRPGGAHVLRVWHHAE